MFYDDLFTPLLDTLTALDGVEYAGLCFAPPDDLQNLVTGHLPACRLWLERLDWQPNLTGTALVGTATVSVALLANPAHTGMAQFLTLVNTIYLVLNDLTTSTGLLWKIGSEQSYGSQGNLGHLFRFTAAVER
jgi:hypothetical protein